MRKSCAILHVAHPGPFQQKSDRKPDLTANDRHLTVHRSVWLSDVGHMCFANQPISRSGCWPTLLYPYKRWFDSSIHSSSYSCAPKESKIAWPSLSAWLSNSRRSCAISVGNLTCFAWGNGV